MGEVVEVMVRVMVELVVGEEEVVFMVKCGGGYSAIVRCWWGGGGGSGVYKGNGGGGDGGGGVYKGNGGGDAASVCGCQHSIYLEAHDAHFLLP